MGNGNVMGNWMGNIDEMGSKILNVNVMGNWMGNRNVVGYRIGNWTENAGGKYTNRSCVGNTVFKAKKQMLILQLQEASIDFEITRKQIWILKLQECK